MHKKCVGRTSTFDPNAEQAETYIPISIKVVHKSGDRQGASDHTPFQLSEVRVQQFVARLRPPGNVYDEIATFITQLT